MNALRGPRERAEASQPGTRVGECVLTDVDELFHE
jgi:hypothetical protein